MTVQGLFQTHCKFVEQILMETPLYVKHFVSSGNRGYIMSKLVEM